jgi:TonB family protein
MKLQNLSRIKSAHPRLLSLFALASLMLSLTLFSQIGHAQQQAQLSLADVLIGLRSKKVTLDERNKLLSGAVIERGITFSLTPEIETELVGTGANRELVEAIRQKSERIILAVASKPVSTSVSVSAPAATPALDYAFYRKRADENSSKGEYDLAVSDYNKAIELNPKDPAAYLNRGRVYSDRKSYDLAILDYDKTIELDPKDSTAYFKRGDVYEKKGNLQQAINDYQKAAELDASNESAKNNLKRLLDEQAKTLLKPKVQEAPVVSSVPKTAEPPVVPKSVDLGQLNGFALKLMMPVYPELAQKLNAHGKVTVQITLDEEGKVISAKATNGSSLLRAASEDAARKSKFKPTLVGNQAVKATGFITYNFVDKM